MVVWGRTSPGPDVMICGRGLLGPGMCKVESSECQRLYWEGQTCGKPGWSPGAPGSNDRRRVCTYEVGRKGLLSCDYWAVPFSSLSAAPQDNYTRCFIPPAVTGLTPGSVDKGGEGASCEAVMTQ